MGTRRPRTLAATLVLSVLVLSALGLLTTASSASASTTPRLWVNNTVATVTGDGHGCAQPGFGSVQAAVDAAAALPRATVLLCPGRYAEQVQVTGATNLTLRAAVPRLGATLALPETPASSTTPCDTAPINPAFLPEGPFQPDQDGFAVCGSHRTTVTVVGLTFDEAWPTGAPCTDDRFGILVGGGDTLKLESSAIVAGGAVPLNGCRGGVGVQAGMAWTLPAERGHLVMANSTSSGYQATGIAVDGAGSTASIAYDRVQGAGPTAVVAQTGIQVSDGAFATIAHTTVSGNECDLASCGPDPLTQAQAVGIGFTGARAGSSIQSCVIDHNDVGVAFASLDPALSPTVEDALLFSTVSANRYEDVRLGQGRDLVASDRLVGGDVGLMLLQYHGQSYGDHAQVDSSILRASTVAAVRILSDRAATGDLPGNVTLKATFVHGFVVSNATNYTVTYRR